MDCLINIDNNKYHSYDCLNLMITSKAGQRLIISEDEDGEFNIKFE